MMNLSSHLGNSDIPVVTSDGLSPDPSAITTPPPFLPGEWVRPRCPAHPWRQYPIVVETCALIIGQVWLLRVSIQAPAPIPGPLKVLAEDYERVGRPLCSQFNRPGAED